ncbi:hypothetical protein PLESTF_000600800 [Pleodorina starrii]|nr:hypothetical protein PLESTF_000600800 [Pleodorina starrii]
MPSAMFICEFGQGLATEVTLGQEGQADPPSSPGVAARARSLLLSTLSSCALLLSSISFPALSAESVTIKFPASRDPEIRSAQEVLVQAWGYVREYYVDPTFNKQDWNQRLQDALAATFRARSRDEALQQVGVLLDSLGDPFTRVLLPGGASEAFRAMTQAKIVSTGLVVGRLGTAEGPLVVSFVVQGSPAAAAGLREGDEVVAVDGRPVWALRGDDARSLQDLLRQDVEVRLKVRRPMGRAAASGGSAAALARRVTAAAAAAAPAQPELPAQPTFSSPVSEPILDQDQDQGTTSNGVRAAGKLSEAAAPAAPPAASSTSYQLPGSFFDVVLRPAPVEFVPVQYAVLDKGTVGLAASGRRGGGGYPAASTSSAMRTPGAPPQAPAPSTSPPPPPPPASPSRVGYIRIVAFTERVASQVESAIRALQAEGCGSWLLDVRGNPGGIVSEGLGVAELLMPPGQVFALVRDRSGEEHAERLTDRARALVDGQPLAVLVDHYSASTSELLAGALHDNARALLFGERTYGKGRTQQVVQLYGGATLLVSTDTYVTPGRRPVDRVGLAPDVACRPGPPPPPVSRPAAAARAAAPAATAAETVSSGGGIGAGEPGSSGGGGGVSMVREQIELLARDACVRAAVGKLTRGSPPSPPSPPQQQAPGA